MRKRLNDPLDALCEAESNFLKSLEEFGRQVDDAIAELEKQGIQNLKKRAEELKNKRIKFILDGCDISFIAEAPANITLEQLLEQCDRIKPDWCACGIRSCDEIEAGWNPEIIIDYDDIRKANDDVRCRIEEVKE